MPVLRQPGALAPYQQIRSLLRADILNNMSPGDKLPPERDLATKFGVNRGTVSHAISALVTEGLLVRRERRGTFIANGDNGRAREMTRSVGLVMPYVQGAFPAGMIRGTIRALREHQYRGVLFDSDNSMMEEARELERVVQEGLDGALVMPVVDVDNTKLFGRLIRLGFPLVFLDRRPLSLDCDCVCTDNFWGAYELTSRLIARGHRRIAHFTWIEEHECTSIQHRRLGYEQALKDNGIEPDSGLVYPPTLFHKESEVYKASLAYLRQGKDPVTAVFAMCDHFGYATIAAAVALGIRIPEELEVAGFFDGLFKPVGPEIPLLRAVQRQAEIGRQAVDLLVRRINGIGGDGPQTITIRPDILDWANPKRPDGRAAPDNADAYALMHEKSEFDWHRP